MYSLAWHARLIERQRGLWTRICLVDFILRTDRLLQSHLSLVSLGKDCLSQQQVRQNDLPKQLLMRHGPGWLGWLEFQHIPVSAWRIGSHPSQTDFTTPLHPNTHQQIITLQVSKAGPAVGNPWKWHSAFWWELKGLEWPTGFSAGGFVILLTVALNLRLALHKHACWEPTCRISFLWQALSWPGPVSPRGEGSHQFLAGSCKSWSSLPSLLLPELSRLFDWRLKFYLWDLGTVLESAISLSLRKILAKFREV